MCNSIFFSPLFILYFLVYIFLKLSFSVHVFYDASFMCMPIDLSKSQWQHHYYRENKYAAQHSDISQLTVCHKWLVY